MKRLVYMAFDGNCEFEEQEFKTIEEVWEFVSGIGYKWHFYRFFFIVEAEDDTVVSTPYLLERFEGMNINDVADEFREVYESDDMQGASDVDFVYAISNS